MGPPTHGQRRNGDQNSKVMGSNLTRVFVPLCDPIFLPVANAQMGKLGNFSVLQLTLKNYSLYLV